MLRPIAALLALTAATSLQAQSAAPATPDFGTAVPLPGSWTYAQNADGSQASFAGADTRPLLALRCTHSTRQVSVSRFASAAAPQVALWTSTLSKNIAASFDAASETLSFSVWAYDPLLDAIAFSRGRIALMVSGQPALVVPVWAEAARVIEDCRM